MTDQFVTMVTDVDDVLWRRKRAKDEIDRLKLIVESCDGEIMAALDADYDEFNEWVKEVRGEVSDYEARKIRWTDGKDNYIVFKRKGSRPKATISAEKLLKAGVPAHVIQQATAYGKPGKEGISVRKVVSGFSEDVEEE